MRKESVKVLVIDDDPKVPWILSEGLGENYQIISARNGVEGIQMVTKEKPELVLLDIKMPGLSGMEVLDKVKTIDGNLDVIMLSGHGDTQNVVESIRRGASEFINKPFNIEEVEIHIRTALEKNRLKKEVTRLKSKLEAKSAYDTLIGDSPQMLAVKNVIEQVADSELTVLILGESGTGKEIVARMLHALSSRAQKPFTKVNCAAIPRELLEAELFGYEKGAFTGAVKNKPGRFEIASTGTIFLDEIGDMPLELQSKLLQVLEQNEFIRVGGLQTVRVDVRIVCATNKNVEEALQKGIIREDLFYRLNEITIQLPPLREKSEDIPLLVDHFLQRYRILYERDFLGLSPEALKALKEYSWPGNVRQLENLIKQIVVRNDESMVFELSERIATETSSGGPEPPSSKAEGELSLKRRISALVTQEEKKVISEALRRTNWNRRKAAKLLEISYRSLLYKIKDYGIVS
ncbi:MAG: sigma-54-dependent Fis family transcriptional regulator [Candidatus Zixiibacteriota bacterium]|nr:MAG: sigma-54-dependent Fis family transcriptional regulator [candidate division Zixibacteria bacterium]